MKPRRTMTPLTAEESRYLDGTLAPDRVKRMERLLAADPDRAERVRQWRTWMGLWRDDCSRVVPSDASRTDRIVQAALEGKTVASHMTSPDDSNDGRATSPGWSVPAHVARRYAAAALVLMALGLVGTWVTRTAPAGAAPRPMLERPTNDGIHTPTEFEGIRNSIQSDAMKNDVLRAPADATGAPASVLNPAEENQRKEQDAKEGPRSR